MDVLEEGSLTQQNNKALEPEPSQLKATVDFDAEYWKGRKIRDVERATFMGKVRLSGLGVKYGVSNAATTLVCGGIGVMLIATVPAAMGAPMAVTGVAAGFGVFFGAGTGVIGSFVVLERDLGSKKLGTGDSLTKAFKRAYWTGFFGGLVAIPTALVMGNNALDTWLHSNALPTQPSYEKFRTGAIEHQPLPTGITMKYKAS